VQTIFSWRPGEYLCGYAHEFANRYFDT